MLYDMNTFTESVAAKVRARAAEQRVTQKDISNKTGIAPSTLGRRMTGVNPWDTDQLAKVANVLDCLPGDLIPQWPKSAVDEAVEVAA